MSLTAIGALGLVIVFVLVGVLLVLDVCSETWIMARIAHLEKRVKKLESDYREFWHGEGHLSQDPMSFSLKRFDLYSQLEVYNKRLIRVRERKQRVQADNQKST
jgi:hypothetical protein